MATSSPPVRSTPRVLLGAIVLGIGLAGTLDEAILHQLLDWHHFLDRSRDGRILRALGLWADGWLHLGSTALVMLGLVLLLAGTGTLRGQGRRALGGVLVGLGGFNLYDAVVQHKILGLHQVRRGVENLLLYDLAFGGSALLALVLGLVLLRRSGRNRPSVQGQTTTT
jgi:uncharacterized membrane protein